MPTQMCQFHLIAIVMRALRKKHQSYAGRELKSIIKTLKTSTKNEFYLNIWMEEKTSCIFKWTFRDDKLEREISL